MTTFNPCDLRGIAFIELVAPDPDAIHRLLLAFGFSRTMRHADRGIDLYQQGEIVMLLARGGGFAAKFATLHGPSICSMGWRAGDVDRAASTAVARGARRALGDHRRLDGTSVPAVYGIGESLIYFVDDGESWTDLGFVPLARPELVPAKGFRAIDHLTNNVPRGELARWAAFYEGVFGFTQVRYFDIRGVKTGLHSFALRSPCGTFCIPINEGTETGSQIDEYLEEYRGPGIQHLAFLTDDILASLCALEGTPIGFLDIDAEYYAAVFDRVPNVREDRAELERRNVLVDGDPAGYLLQIFTRNLIGPIFIELIQRRNHASFGEGNFGALFRSISATSNAGATSAEGGSVARRSIIEPFKIKVVEPLPRSTAGERERILTDAGFNLFAIRAADVTFDFLTDSGTTAMSASQWGAMMVADESYAGSRSFYRFEEVVRRITGYDHVVPTHQGRAAEHLLFSLHCKRGELVPSNNHFDTTRANLEQLGVEAVDLVVRRGPRSAIRGAVQGQHRRRPARGVPRRASRARAVRDVHRSRTTPAAASRCRSRTCARYPWCAARPACRSSSMRAGSPRTRGSSRCASPASATGRCATSRTTCSRVRTAAS